jgi:hypothetical protein
LSLTNVNLTQGSGIPAVGTTLSVGNNGSPLVYNLIGNQAKITFGPKVDSADTTNQGSQWDQSIPTLLVGGEVGVEIFYIPNTPGKDGTTGLVGHAATDQGALMGMFYNEEIRPWLIQWPSNNGGAYFEAYILEAPVTSDPTGKALMISMKLKITGNVQPFD